MHQQKTGLLKFLQPGYLLKQLHSAAILRAIALVIITVIQDPWLCAPASRRVYPLMHISSCP